MKQFTIIDAADQQFSTILNNRRVTFRIRYNVTTDRWSMDLSIDDLPILHGIRLVAGVDILAPFNLGIGHIYLLATSAGIDPDRDGLPSGLVRMYWLSDEEVETYQDLLQTQHVAR